MNFEFDPTKSAVNKTKHGVDFIQAQVLWDDENLLALPLRFEDERRIAYIGRMGGKHWTAIATCRGKAVRIITLRRGDPFLQVGEEAPPPIFPLVFFLTIPQN